MTKYIPAESTKKKVHESKEVSMVFKNLINSTSGSIYVVQDGIIVFHNPPFAKLTGFSSKELNEMNYLDLVHAKDKKLIKLLFSNNFREISLKKSHSFTFRVNHKSGEVRWFKSNVSIIEWNGKPALLDNCIDITQQKEFEERLVQEEMNFRLLVNAFEDMIFIISKRGTIIQANQSVYRHLGYAENQVLLKNFSNFFNDQERESISKTLSQALLGNRQLINAHIVSVEGAKIPVETRFFCGSWSQKEVVFAICQDISARLEAEKAIMLSEEKFSKAFETNAVMMTISTLDEGRLIDVNETFLKVIGLKREHVIGKTSAELKIFPDISMRTKLLKKIIAKGKATDMETTLVNSKKQKLICQFSVEIIDIQGSPCLLTVMTDITLRKQSEQKILMSEQRFRQLAELLPEMIFEANAKGRITFGNNYLLSSFNITQKDLKKGIHISKLFGSKSQKIIKEYILSSNQSPELHTVELSARKGNGTEFPSLTHVIAILENSEVKRYMGVLVDITNRKHQEIELLRAKKEAEEASKAKEKFLSTMSHEIRTPMNAIIGITNILLQENPEESQLENLRTLKFSAENLMALLNDILDFSKIEAGKLKINRTQFNITHLTEGIINTFKNLAQSKGVELKLDLDERIPAELICDQVRLNQVLSNITANAIKFTHKGLIQLKIALLKETKSKVQIYFSVIDTGIGISAEKQKILFKEFTQANFDTARKYGGTGLGLAISQKLIQLLGGKIEVKSKPNKGSEFFFTLSLSKSKNTAKIGSISEELLTYNFDKAYKVLVVEDNEINSMIVSNFLKKWGLEIELAENGLIALEMLEKNMYDIILMDLEMPEMNGYDATVEIRKMKDIEKNSIPIIALTASAMLDVQTKIFSLGMNGFILKPFSPNELKKKIYEVLKTSLANTSKTSL